MKKLLLGLVLFLASSSSLILKGDDRHYHSSTPSATLALCAAGNNCITFVNNTSYSPIVHGSHFSLRTLPVASTTKYTLPTNLQNAELFVFIEKSDGSFIQSKGFNTNAIPPTHLNAGKTYTFSVETVNNSESISIVTT